MSLNLNRVILAGRLTRDPEWKPIGNESGVVNFGLAVNRSWTKDGEKKEEVLFVDVKFFGRSAETVSKFFQRGKGILVEGHLVLEQWEKDGEKRSKIVVVGDSFSFTESKKDGEGEQGHAPDTRRQDPRRSPPPRRTAPAPAGDDIPY